jgi:hypothetical protein
VKSCGLEGREQEFLDSLHVLAEGMRHFYAKAMQAKANKGKPEIIDANMPTVVARRGSHALRLTCASGIVKVGCTPGNSFHGPGRMAETRPGVSPFKSNAPLSF